MLNEPFPDKCDEHTRLKHLCAECSKEYLTTIASQLSESRKFSICMPCFSKHAALQVNTYKLKLGKKFDYITSSDLKGIANISTFKCDCGHVFKTSLKKLLKQKIGCDCKILKEPVSDVDATEAIKLMASKGVNASINTKVVIQYTFQSKQRTYYPTIAYKNLVLDVLTLEELVLNFEKMKSKAKAAIRQKFKHKLMLESKILPLEWLKWKVDDVYKYIRKRSINHLRILAFDPGSNNFAWSVLDVSRPFSVKLLGTGMLKNTVKELTGCVRQQYDDFIFEVSALCIEYEVDHIIAERFMHRPGIKGLTMELVGQMLGILLTKWIEWGKEPESMKLITASQWKNEWNRFSDLKAFYDKVGCTVHQVDSIGIGLYGAAYWLDEKPFETISVLESELLEQLV